LLFRSPDEPIVNRMGIEGEHLPVNPSSLEVEEKHGKI
jgi:hypothetical protein